MFEPAKKFVLTATSKYQLAGPAAGAIVCEKARQVIKRDYPNFITAWRPKKFTAGSLTISASGSSGAELFMQTQTFLLKLREQDLPQSVQQIKIVKG